jgi:alpha-galactosidase
MSQPNGWTDRVLAFPYAAVKPSGRPMLQLLRQDFEELERNRSVIKTPMKVGSRSFAHGLGTHSVGHIRVTAPEPIARFAAWVGVDNNERTQGGAGSVVFVVSAGERELFRSPVMRGGQEARRVETDCGGARTLDLRVEGGGDGPACDHADWAEAAITTQDGKTIRLDQMEEGVADLAARYPFSFTYGGKSGDELLETCRKEQNTEKLDANRTRLITTWTDPATGLRVRMKAVRYADYPALEWLLWFENTGKADTPILADVQAMDLTFRAPMPGQVPYLVHRSNGGTPTPDQFEATVLPVGGPQTATLGAGCGRSSTKDFPFFKIETGEGSAIVAVGWSGDWLARLESPDRKQLRVTAGLERTRFLLHPGEKVRSPRILVMYRPGDTLESNAQFRQLIYKHYAAKWKGKTPLPILFCNTCFTRGGGWLNECNAGNQISLIKAYAPLGLEALLTDAGWFEGGWPAGAGNWTPRRDAYPQGMGPVAAAAKEHGMIYGLWFEPERVVASTEAHRKHPEWCLASQKGQEGTYLLNFGLPEAQDYFFNIVKGFMDLPGFRVYRQDFNMDPLPYWRFNDAPDRVGITEMKYVAGLYAFWDRIAQTWPDSLREECASGGHRMDLETVMRMHIHQKTDYWFDNETDQASIWALSQYLPNNTFVAPINRLDDYSFHSVMATSLCMGWIADAPDFDAARGKKLLDRYLQLRPLLVGAYYPLLPYSRGTKEWTAMQWHRPDLNEGMILAFRRADSPYRTAEVSLRGLDAGATYELRYDSSGAMARASGAELMGKYLLTLPEKHRSELIVYKRVKD